MTIQLKVVQRVLGLLLAFFSITMLSPVIVSLIYRDGASIPFLGAFAATVTTGLLMYFPVRHEKAQLRLRDGFVIVVLFWAVLGIVGGLPFFTLPTVGPIYPSGYF